MLSGHHHLTVETSDHHPFPSSNDHDLSNKRKRRPAGTPDPDAEVVSLSPKTLLESDRYVCEICNQGFQRDQNLQMHRRRHKVPWKLVKRESSEVIKKRVFVCPEPSCLHHDPCHALGDLVGIKKHFRRKHSNNKQWVCEKCSKGYAVQSDYKAHLKTCGTRGHSCDCGRVFSRVESFIEHQDACMIRHIQPDLHPFRPTCSPHNASSNTLSSQTNLSQTQQDTHNNLELQLLPSSSLFEQNNNKQTHLFHDNQEEKVKMAMAEMAFAEESRQKAKRLIEMAEMEFAKAKRIRQQAQVELERAKLQQEQVTKKVNSAILEITCDCCKQGFQGDSNKALISTTDETSIGQLSYMSSAVTEGEGD